MLTGACEFVCHVGQSGKNVTNVQRIGQNIVTFLKLAFEDVTLLRVSNNYISPRLDVGSLGSVVVLD
jgi:hypothetical protein